jgi:hypothetical protein
MAAAQCPEIPSRCHHCAGPLSKDMVMSRRPPTPVILVFYFSIPLLGDSVFRGWSWALLFVTVRPLYCCN